MANPNLVSVTAIYGNSSSYLVSSTADPFATALVSNAASSGKVYKLNSIVVANVNASSAANITIKIFPTASLGGTGVALISTASVPQNASLVVLDKTMQVYLLENQSIGATAGTANALSVTCSWEELS